MTENRRSILFINGHLRVGGVENSLINLINNVDFKEFDVDLLLLQGGYDYEPDLPREVNVIKIDLDQAAGPMLSSMLRNVRNGNWICVRYRLLNLMSRLMSKKVFRHLHISKKLRSCYDCVISYRPGICADIALHSVVADKKICWWHHGSLDVGISNLSEQLAGFDRVVGVSRGVGQMLVSNFPMLRSKITVIPNVVDIECINRKADAYTPYEKSEGHKIKLVSVSRLSAEKNVIKAVEVAKILKSRNIDFSWHIIGGGDCEKDIMDAIRLNELEAYVFLEGSLSNPYPWIKSSDILVHLSPVESFGIVIIEAMALKTLCIAVKSIGAEELINGDNGLLVEDSDTDIAESIISALNGEYYIDRMKASAYSSVQKFSGSDIYKLFCNTVND